VAKPLGRHICDFERSVVISNLKIGDRDGTKLRDREDSTGAQPALMPTTSLSGARALLLVPDLFLSPGGIARHGRLVWRALQDAGIHTTTISLLDGPDHTEDASRTFGDSTFRGCAGNKKRFGQETLAALRARPDIVLVDHPHFSPLGLLAAQLARTPFVVFAHGVEVWGRLTRVRRIALQRADLVLCVSHVTIDRATASNGLSPEKVRVLYNCLDPSFTPVPRVERSHLSMLTVSRIVLSNPYKGHSQVISALPALLHRFPNLIYDIVGDGDAIPSLEALATELDVRTAVRFHGLVSDQDLAHLYADSSLFIMPSRSEGFGYVFVESMAQGTPVIAGNQDASPEVVVNGETGFLVNPTSVTEITEAAARLLEDSELRKRMGERAARHANETFGYQSFRRNLISYLACLVSRSRAK
jgi:phosphatidyl-myo-inositol dimannoside synthase